MAKTNICLFGLCKIDGLLRQKGIFELIVNQPECYLRRLPEIKKNAPPFRQG